MTHQLTSPLYQFPIGLFSFLSVCQSDNELVSSLRWDSAHCLLSPGSVILTPCSPNYSRWFLLIAVAFKAPDAAQKTGPREAQLVPRNPVHIGRVFLLHLTEEFLLL